MSSPSTSAAAETSKGLLHMVWLGVIAYVVVVILNSAYRIRMHAIEEFGPVIHEFDPYFNYRATEVSLLDCHCVIVSVVSW
jgi:dolichyl-diphosphooligosaccharide---protein glycosyltransferase